MVNKSESVPLIFISYTRADKDRVLPFFDDLRTKGFNVWMDHLLKDGQNWDFEIKRALNKATITLVFLSENSVVKRGYVQREIKLALEKFEEKLEDDICIIPVKLDNDIFIPEQLKGIHCLSAAEPECLEQIADSIEHQLENVGIELTKTQKREHFYWNSMVKKESWDGIPGYEVELQFLNFKSEIYPNASEIGDYIKGQPLAALFKHRESKIFPSPACFNYAQEKYQRTNTYDAYCNDPIILGTVMSVQHNIHWYGAGSAHPNTEFLTYSFILHPLMLISSLEDVFTNPDEAILCFRQAVRARFGSGPGRSALG